MNTRVIELLGRGKQILHEEGSLSFLKHVLLFSVSLVSKTLIRLYIVCRAVYLRLSFIPCLTKTKRDHDSIDAQSPEDFLRSFPDWAKGATTLEA